MCIVSLLKGYNKSYLMLKSQVDISTENHELQQFIYQAQSLNKRSPGPLSLYWAPYER